MVVYNIYSFLFLYLLPSRQSCHFSARRRSKIWKEVLITIQRALHVTMCGLIKFFAVFKLIGNAKLITNFALIFLHQSSSRSDFKLRNSQLRVGNVVRYAYIVSFRYKLVLVCLIFLLSFSSGSE